MKKLFYLGLFGLAAFEVANVYFIMPMPGSQRIGSLPLAYFLYTWRWAFRIAFGLLAVAGARAALRVGRWVQLIGPAVVLLLVGAIAGLLNFKLSADQMFLQPAKLVFFARDGSKVPEDTMVIGIENGGAAKAYPIRYLAYHHQVRDSLAGLPIMVTYCAVCRTGRVDKPVVEGAVSTFRLVGMDRFNTIFEDAATGTWWRQANGEGIAGPLKGALLPEIPSMQCTLREWFSKYPASLVMQPDKASEDYYGPM